MNPISAERHLLFKFPSGAVEDVVVRFFVPHQIEQGDWQCDYEIQGDSIHRILYAAGIDSVQALSLALNSVRAHLDYIERKHNAKFYFLGEPGHEFK
ncbi:DUF6968 family protein [Xanthomonas campestris]|uniref:DUF6968 family protein n=1 Tax=Xanthomonas campestris TaxID=339 RepID=UPI002B225287|nr:hypothetical protein [Xanthomonas campestris]MEA9728069.1 hypothetical protein [Xanthomonas campestris pv. raphani]MEA9752174.1 hypothetical protein [Xanthomonas campestris pv. raphani]MEA9812512.1 hypothetical protein [Xanthomonas campestris pv. raphani]